MLPFTEERTLETLLPLAVEVKHSPGGQGSGEVVSPRPRPVPTRISATAGHASRGKRHRELLGRLNLFGMPPAARHENALRKNLLLSSQVLPYPIDIAILSVLARKYRRVARQHRLQFAEFRPTEPH